MFRKLISATAIFAGISAASDDHLDVMRDCGAVPKTSLNVELNDTVTNAKALETCIEKANNGGKTVVIPKGYAFSATASSHANLTDVALQIDGVWEASPYYQEWPTESKHHKSGHGHLKGRQDLKPFLQFIDCTNLTIKGQGTVDGLGYDWWVREWEKKNPHGRPHLLQYDRVQDSEISGVKFLNSPRFNL